MGGREAEAEVATGCEGARDIGGWPHDFTCCGTTLDPAFVPALVPVVLFAAFTATVLTVVVVMFVAVFVALFTALFTGTLAFSSS